MRLLLPLLLLLAPSARPAAAQDDAAKNRLKVLARDAKDQVEKTRHAAWEALLDLGEEGVAILKPIVADKMARDRKLLEERFKGAPLGLARKKVEEALVARRQTALACIFDRARYPDADHGRVGQPEVDRLVGEVAAAYDHPATFTRTALPEVEALAAGLEEDLVYFEACGEDDPPDLPTVAAWLGRFDAAFHVEQMGISEAQIAWNAELDQYHQGELLTSADAEELACMDATNAYRRKMGMRLFEIDERLVRAARKHSEEMHTLDYFDHTSPVPENRTPSMRAAREGHSGGGGENANGDGGFHLGKEDAL